MRSDSDYPNNTPSSSSYIHYKRNPLASSSHTRCHRRWAARPCPRPEVTTKEFATNVWRHTTVISSQSKNGIAVHAPPESKARATPSPRISLKMGQHVPVVHALVDQSQWMVVFGSKKSGTHTSMSFKIVRSSCCDLWTNVQRLQLLEGLV